MTITIDKDRALELLAKAVKEKGEDYVYPRSNSAKGTYGKCLYVEDDGTPSCIVGHVIGYVKPSLLPLVGTWERNECPERDEYDFPPKHTTIEQGFGFSTGATYVADSLERSDLLRFTPEAVSVLSRAQRIQDGGETWGKALEEAKK